MILWQSFSRRGGKGKKAVGDDTPSIGGAAGGAGTAGAAGPGASSTSGAAAEGEAYAAEDSVVQRPDFKLAGQADPLRESIQKEAVMLYEAGAYDDAGEKFYFLVSNSTRTHILMSKVDPIHGFGGFCLF